jgi:hypothetical protein
MLLNMRSYMRPPVALEIRFINLIDVKEDLNQCWIWKGCKNPRGYGRFTLTKGKMVFTHRLMYELKNGEIPKGMLVCHTCDNPSCVNPNHLWLGTHKENHQDMVSKGRQAGGRGKGSRGRVTIYNLINYSRGSTRPASKLNEEKVKKIKLELLEGKKISSIAKEHNVTTQLIGTIKRGTSWKHVIV